LPVPIIQVVEGVTDALGPIVGEVVNGVLSPVLGTVEPVLDGVLSPVLGAVEPLLDGVLTPVLGAVEPVLDGVLTPVVGAVDPVLDGVLTPVVQVASPVPDDLLMPVVQAVDPVLDAVLAPADLLAGQPGGTVEAVAAVIGDGGAGNLATLLGFEAGGQQPIVVGSLSFPDGAVAAGAQPDALFSGGGYTDYGLSLHSQPPGGSDETAVLGPSPSSTLLDQALGGTFDADPDEGADAPNVSLPSALQEIAQQGLGGGIQL
jgi:hypothetical protein